MHRVLGRVGRKGNLRIGDALQEQRLLQQFLRILTIHHRCGHARKGREFVHHAADVTHLTHNGVGALLEDFGIGDDLARIFALQAFGG